MREEEVKIRLEYDMEKEQTQVGSRMFKTIECNAIQTGDQDDWNSLNSSSIT